MQFAASMWIRDGVLVNRMHINPTAFAVAYKLFAPPPPDGEELRPRFLLEELINFGFEKSGISCREKMELFNEERGGSLKRIDEAVEAYNYIATAAAASCDYFPGAPELLKALSEHGVRNFITSAVEQPVLDEWRASNQGKIVAPYLEQILGSRESFRKGRDHFKYISEMVGGEPVVYVADAPSEIRAASQFATEFNIIPIGFGHVIDVSQILRAAFSIELIAQDFAATHGLEFSIPLAVVAHALELPSAVAVVSGLNDAGAKHVVTGSESEIIHELWKLVFG